MRATTRDLLKYYVNDLKMSGKVLEIGGHEQAMCAMNEFPSPRFEYFDLNLEKGDIENTIIGDITDVPHIDDSSYDVIFSSDVFEHINRPWLAAKEISRILKPGGLVITATLWSWRNHPCPIDYWRYSPECLEFLFSDLVTLEKGFDLSLRRHDEHGFWQGAIDAVPLDGLGGWRENWAVYHVAVKGQTEHKVPKPYKKTNLRYAKYLRMDVQGKVQQVERQRREFAGRRENGSARSFSPDISSSRRRAPLLLSYKTEQVRLNKALKDSEEFADKLKLQLQNCEERRIVDARKLSKFKRKLNKIESSKAQKLARLVRRLCRR